MTVKLGTLAATGKLVDVTRFRGPFNLIVLQLQAETGYIQVGADELLKLLLHPVTRELRDPMQEHLEALELAVREIPHLLSVIEKGEQLGADQVEKIRDVFRKAVGQ